MRLGLIIAVALALLVAESGLVTLLGLELWLPHVAVGLMIFLAMRPPFFEAAAAAFVVAWGADLLGGGPPGARAMALTLTFFLLRLASARLDDRSRVLRLLVTVVAAAVAMGLEVLVVAALSGEARMFTTLAVVALPSSLTAPLGMIPAWLALDRVERLFTVQKGTLEHRR